VADRSWHWSSWWSGWQIQWLVPALGGAGVPPVGVDGRTVLVARLAAGLGPVFGVLPTATRGNHHSPTNHGVAFFRTVHMG
jgi:hypothetical protein